MKEKATSTGSNETRSDSSRKHFPLETGMEKNDAGVDVREDGARNEKRRWKKKWITVKLVERHLL